jgi:hypothetical protein
MVGPVYVELPEDVLESIRLLLIYFSLPRWGEARPVYPRSIKRAARILGIDNRWVTEERNVWRLPDKEKMRARLALAGLNPDNPMEIIDQEKWDLAWRQLSTTDRFNIAAQQQAIAMGETAPKAQSVVQQFIDWPKKKRSNRRSIDVICF